MLAAITIDDHDRDQGQITRIRDVHRLETCRPDVAARRQAARLLVAIAVDLSIDLFGIGSQHVTGQTESTQATTFDPGGAPAQIPDIVGAMRYEDNGHSGPPDPMDGIDAFLLKSGVTHRQHLIDHEGLRSNIDRYRKSKPHVHSR